MLITIYKRLNVFLNILKTCLLCVSLYTLLQELKFYHYVNLLPLLMFSTLSVTLHLSNGTPYLIFYDMRLLYLVLEDS